MTSSCPRGRREEWSRNLSVENQMLMSSRFEIEFNFSIINNMSHVFQDLKVDSDIVKLKSNKTRADT